MNGQPKLSSRLGWMIVVVLGVSVLGFAALALLGSRLGPRSGTSPMNGCINNLRQLDGAVQQWALDRKKQPEDFVTLSNAMEYISPRIRIACPSGGKYTVGPLVSNQPTCSIAGHVLPQP